MAKLSFAIRWGHPRRLKALKPDTHVNRVCPRPRQIWVDVNGNRCVKGTHYEGAIAIHE